jgi:para-aminobenzoate synthetase component 1
MELYSTLGDAFWLDSGEDATEGFSYLGAPSFSAAIAIEEIVDGRVGVKCGARVHEGTMFDFLAQEVVLSTDTREEDAGFQLGWVGWFGYETGRAAMMRITRTIVFDHKSREVLLRGRVSDPDLETWFNATSAQLHDMPPSVTLLPSTDRQKAKATLRHPRDEYLRLIVECQEAIRRGDAYQLCLTNEIVVAESRDPVATYRRLRLASPSHHGALIRIGDTSLLGISPEQFLSVTPNGDLLTRPIKGTRPRGANRAEDARLRTDLMTSEKERAENVMIVDLMRNDLGRVAVVGSVAVPELFVVEAYANVFQLVSTVVARLDPAFHPVDAIKASFPAGSMTGAPKASAMKILAKLEAGSRGIYAGAHGYLGFDGRVDLAMTIRSIVMTSGRTTIGTGGGITALSVPDDEFDEILVKAAPLLASLGAKLG